MTFNYMTTFTCTPINNFLLLFLLQRHKKSLYEFTSSISVLSAPCYFSIKMIDDQKISLSYTIIDFQLSNKLNRIIKNIDSFQFHRLLIICFCWRHHGDLMWLRISLKLKLFKNMLQILMESVFCHHDYKIFILSLAF